MELDLIVEREKILSQFDKNARHPHEKERIRNYSYLLFRATRNTGARGTTWFKEGDISLGRIRRGGIGKIELDESHNSKRLDFGT